MRKEELEAAKIRRRRRRRKENKPDIFQKSKIESKSKRHMEIIKETIIVIKREKEKERKREK